MYGFLPGRGNNLKKILSQNFPHSLGSFYSTFTEFCGFKPRSTNEAHKRSLVVENQIITNLLET